MFHDWVRSRADLFRVLLMPAFALTVLTVVSRPRSQGAVDEDTVSELETTDNANALTKRVYESINAGGKIFLSSTVVKGVYAIRVVSANPRADAQHLRRAFDILVETTENLLGL